MINDKTKKLLILNKLKNVGNATLENIIKIDGYDLKDVEELVESIPKQRKVKNDKNAILEAEEKAHIDINESNNILLMFTLYPSSDFLRDYFMDFV